MVCPQRVASRYKDLQPEEISDLFVMAQKVSKAVESYYSATSVTMAIQDGPEAGQTVPHVHLHILPRVAGDFLSNDQIYAELQKHDKEEFNFGDERQLRSLEDMEKEASDLKQFILQ